MSPKMRSARRPLGVFALLVLVSAFLSGCYLPMRYDVEIEITRTGHYKMIFDGYMVKVDLYNDLRQNKLTPTQEREEVAKMEREFAADKNASDFSYLRKGYFKVHWEREGDLLQSRTVSFVRKTKSHLVVQLAYNKRSGRIGMTGRSLQRKQRRQLNEIGLGGTNGEIRVISDLPMVSNNATKTVKNRSRGPGFKTYIWKVKNIFSPTPSVIFAIHGPRS